MSSLNQEQPKPITNETTPIWELVIADMHERDNIGRRKYGTPLQVFNNRDGLVDLYQELLDSIVYVRKEIEERKLKQDLLARLETHIARELNNKIWTMEYDGKQAFCEVLFWISRLKNGEDLGVG